MTITIGAASRVLPMRRAIRAAAAIMIAPTRRARWYPSSDATICDVPDSHQVVGVCDRDR